MMGPTSKDKASLSWGRKHLQQKLEPKGHLLYSPDNEVKGILNLKLLLFFLK